MRLWNGFLGEIEETLDEARQALESYVENPKDSTQLRFCITHIHQVRGSLQIVEFHGASLLAEEMEALAQAIIAQSVVNVDDAHEVTNEVTSPAAYLSRSCQSVSKRLRENYFALAQRYSRCKKKSVI